jgi:ribosomal protein S27E
MDEPKTKPMGIVVGPDTGAKIAIVKCGNCGERAEIHGHVPKVQCPKCGSDVPAPR